MIVWLASYPRSGNTLVRMILNKRFLAKTYSLYGDLSDIGRSPALRDFTGHANLAPLTPASLKLKRESEMTYFIKTHEPPFVSTCIEDRVIYIARDGRDAVCSYHRYLRKFGERFYSMDDVILGQVLFGQWGEHVLAWRSASRENHLYLKYEDYLSSPENFMRRLQEFVGLPDTDEEMPGFDSLRAANRDFFAKGTARGWVNELSHQQHDLFLHVHGDAMRTLGYLEGSETGSVTPESAQTMRGCLERLRLSDAKAMRLEDAASGKEREIASLCERNTQLAAKLDTASQRNVQLQSQLAAAAKEIRFVCGQNTERSAKLSAAIDQLDTAETTIQSLYTSTSWRLTKPLRWLVSHLRRLLAIVKNSNHAL